MPIADLRYLPAPDFGRARAGPCKPVSPARPLNNKRRRGKLRASLGRRMGWILCQKPQARSPSSRRRGLRRFFEDWPRAANSWEG